MTARTRPQGPAYRRLFAWVAGFEDGAIIRVAFFAMLIGTLSVLYIDYSELTAADASAFVAPDMPILPAFDPDNPMAPNPNVTTDSALLEAPLSIELQPGGVLAVTGTIDVGSAERFATEVAARGDYVDTVALDSPGGSVGDAMAIGALIRARGFDTSVAAGALCASSCPLVLAGGEARMAFEQSAIGVHQIYANIGAGDLANAAANAGTAMADAQKTTAAITRYLQEMGVDSTLWVHAMETPPTQLYYLSSQELTALKLITKLD